jgi:hypothetical protein
VLSHVAVKSDVESLASSVFGLSSCRKGTGTVTPSLLRSAKGRSELAVHCNPRANLPNRSS